MDNGRRLVAVSFLIVVATVLMPWGPFGMPAAKADPPFVSRTQVSNDPTNFEDRPVVIMNASGEIYVAWTRFDLSGGGDHEVYFSRSLDGGLSFEPHLRINDDNTTEIQRSVELALSPNGTIHAIWADARTAAAGVYYARSFDRGASFEPNRWFADSGHSPTIAAEPSGTLHAAWIGSYQVRYANSTDGGETWSPSQQIDYSGIGFVMTPDIAVTDASEVYVTFIANVGGNLTSYLVASPDGGSTWSSPVPLPRQTPDDQSGPSVTTAGSRVGVAWREGEPTGPTRVYGAYSDDGGATFSDIFEIPPGGNSRGVYPTLRMGIGGDAFLTWMRSTPEGTGTNLDVMFSYAADGFNFSAPIRVTDTSFGQQQVPHLFTTPAGEALIVYTDGWMGVSELYFTRAFPPSLPPNTDLVLGTPNYTATQVWITSGTLLSFAVTDPSGDGIAYTEYRVDGGAWINYTAMGPFVLSGEGLHTLEYRSVSLTGTVEPAQEVQMVVDDSSPLSELSVGEPRHVEADLWITSATPLTLEAVDFPQAPHTNMTIQAWVESEPFPGGDFFAYMANSSNRVNWTISADVQEVLFSLIGDPNCVDIDLAVYHDQNGSGDAEPEELVAYDADADAEEQVALDQPTPGQYIVLFPGLGVSPPGCFANLTISEVFPGGGAGVATISYRVFSGGLWSSWSGYAGAISVAEEGRAYVEYYAADWLGNEEVVRNDSVMVDNSPPLVSLVSGTPSHAGAYLWVTSATPVTLEVSDQPEEAVGVLNTWYSVWSDGGWSAPQAYSGVFTLSGEGTVYVEFYSVDRLLNRATTENVTLAIDDAPPVTVLSASAPKYRAMETDLWNVTDASVIALAAQDGGFPPVDGVLTAYRIDDADWVSYDGPFRLEDLEDGVHRIRYQSTDALGNIEPLVDAYVVLDTTPPETAHALLESPTGSHRLRLDASDSGSGVATTFYAIDQGEWQTYAGEIALDEPGMHVVDYYSVDHLGNEETTKSTIVEVTPPTVPSPGSLKLSIAILFALVIGLFSYLRIRRELAGKSGGGVLRAWSLYGLPFVLLEIATGILSHLTGWLAIPPVLGWGTAVDGGLLTAGLLIPFALTGRSAFRGGGRRTH